MKKIILLLILGILLFGCTQTSTAPKTTDSSVAKEAIAAKSTSSTASDATSSDKASVQPAPTTSQPVAPTQAPPAAPAPAPSTPPAQSAPPAPAKPAPSKVAVSISGFAFNPNTITINAGDTVVWTNNDGAVHTVKFSDGESPTIAKGDTYEKTFNTPGEFSYICGIHTSMQGKVIVK